MDSEIEYWYSTLHASLLLAVPLSPLAYQVPNPSDATLSNLASNMNSLIMTLENIKLKNLTKNAYSTQ